MNVPTDRIYDVTKDIEVRVDRKENCIFKVERFKMMSLYYIKNKKIQFIKRYKKH